MRPNASLRVGLVSPLAPQVGGVASVSEWLIARQRELGCEYSTFDLERPADSESGGKLTWSAIGRQARLLVRFLRWTRSSPSVIHYCVATTNTGLARDLLFVTILRTMRNRLVIAHIHGSDLMSIEPKTFRARTIKLLARQATIRVSIAPSHARALARLGVAAESVMNPVRLVVKRNSRKASQEVRILFVGNFGSRKGCFELVRALALARRAGFDLRLAIVGREERAGEAALLDALVTECELRDRVQFVGYATGEELAFQYREADIFCLPSLREGLPMAILEAMACGLPVIATTAGAIPDIIVSGKHGLLTEPGDVHGLRNAIVSLAEDQDLRGRIAAAARVRVKKVASDELIMSQWRAVYRQAATRVAA